MTNNYLFLTTHEKTQQHKHAELFDFMNIYKVNDDTLKAYECLIVTDQCDQEFLYENKAVIERFLEAGKLVLFFGNLATPWLPGVSLFEPKEIKNYRDYDVQIIGENPIYAGLEADDFIKRRGVAGFFARGHHVPNKGADIYATLGENKPVTFADRVTTNGTVFVHGGFELFDYMMNDQSKTERLTANLIQWCQDELEALKQKPSTLRRRIGVVYSGTSHHIRAYKTGEFAKHISKIIPVRELGTASFDDLDVLIVPSQTNMDAFKPNKHRVDEFADAGGTVVCFGHQAEEWLDEKWELRPTNFWWWLEENATSGLVLTGQENPLFKEYLTLADATWHQHGVYWPEEGTEKLVTTEDGGAVLYIDRQKSKGTWIITTLDPDFHYGHYFMPATERFMRGFFPWLESGEI